MSLSDLQASNAIVWADISTGLSSKSLTRLFPTDQSMVVVIDDRSDVWDDCPNLVKVVPCECCVVIIFSPKGLQLLTLH